MIGLNLWADLRSEIGLAEASRNLVDALIGSNIPLNLQELFYREALGRELPTRFVGLKSPPDQRVNLILLNFNVLEPLIPFLEAERKNGRYNIGYWFWELSQIPSKFHEVIQTVDEIWVASEHVAYAMRKVTPKPVVVIPTPVELTSEQESVSRQYFGIPEKSFAFFFNFSGASSDARKNPWALIQAFEQAFGNIPVPDRPVLVLKFQGARTYPKLNSALQERLNRFGGILLTEPYSRETMDALFRCVDCYVSLHRAEGFGLGMVEAMLAAKPVIATNYSANTDYLDEACGYPVRFKLREILDGDHLHDPGLIDLYVPGSVWADPDIDHAIERMRFVFENQSEAHARGRVGLKRAQEYCGRAVIADKVRTRLDQLSLMGAEALKTPPSMDLIPTGYLEAQGMTASGEQRSVSRSVGILCVDTTSKVEVLRGACANNNCVVSVAVAEPAWACSVNVLAIELGEAAKMNSDNLRWLLDDKYTIAVWDWDNALTPMTIAQLASNVDEIWVEDHPTRVAFQKLCRKPVLVFPSKSASFGKRVHDRLSHISDSLVRAREVLQMAGLSRLAQGEAKMLLALFSEQVHLRNEHIISRNSWYRHRTKDVTWSGRIPLLSGLIRILLRPFLLGKLFDEQNRMNELNERFMESSENSLRRICSILDPTGPYKN